MKKIIFILAMFCCSGVYAATLATNTIPYVCQGGASPQLCNSNVTTNGNGNLNTNGTIAAASFTGQNGAGLLGQWGSVSFNTVYHAATDGFVTGYTIQTSGENIFYFYTDSSPSPSTLRQFGGGASQAGNYAQLACFVRKGDYWEVVSNGGQALYFISLGS